MRILYHHRTQGTGAEGVHIAHIVKGLEALGHSVSVVSPTDRHPEQTAGSSPYGGRKGMRAAALKAISEAAPQLIFECLEVLYNGPAYLKLQRRFHENGRPAGSYATTSGAQTGAASLIYERYAFFTMAGAMLAKKTGTPFIVEVNEVAGEERVREQVLVDLAKRVERYVFNQADAIIVVSDFLKDKIAQLGVRSSKIHVMPNGVDEEVFDPALPSSEVRERLNINSESVVIGFVGWFVAWHNLPLLLDTFADVVSDSKLPADSDIRLLLVGEGGLEQELRDQCRKREIADKVIFAGAVPYRDVPRHIAAMDICVIPHCNAYRSPIKLFEYMAMEKAVLAPRVAPIVKVLEEGVDGVTFEAENREQLRARLTTLVHDATIRERLGRNARHRVLAQHLWRHNVEKILGIYENTRSREHEDEH